MPDWNTVYTDYLYENRVFIFKNNMETSHCGVLHITYMMTVNKPNASLSTYIYGCLDDNLVNYCWTNIIFRKQICNQVNNA